MRLVTFACEECGFWCEKPRRLDSIKYFCSTACSTSWRRSHPLLPYACAHCKKRFGGKGRRVETRHFCSRQCWRARRAAEKDLLRKLSAPARKRKSKSYHQEWYANNRTKKLEQNKEWAKRNKPTLARYARESRKRNPDRATARRFGKQFTAHEWKALKQRYANCCLACRKTEPAITLEPDHVVPLSRGGAGTIDNIQPLCRSCNARKHARTIDYRS